MNKIVIFIISLCMFSLISNAQTEGNFPKSDKQRKSESYGSIFGNNGLQLFGKGKSTNSENRASVTTNTFLWHAALDIIKFMPLASTDFNGGVINTDWYDDKDIKETMYKVNVVIKSSQLNANSLEVKVFKRQLKDGRWHDVKTSDDLANQLEDKILAKARSLKVTQEETQ